MASATIHQLSASVEQVAKTVETALQRTDSACNEAAAGFVPNEERMKFGAFLRLPLYQIDAFATRPFEGNPAAVTRL